MKITIAEALGYSLLGFSLVFVALILLIAVIAVVARVCREKPEAAAAPSGGGMAIPAAPAPVSAAGKVPAKGSLGEVALHGVDDRTAALLMAITADKMNAPLNQLRFISIKEVESK